MGQPFIASARLSVWRFCTVCSGGLPPPLALSPSPGVECAFPGEGILQFGSGSGSTSVHTSPEAYIPGLSPCAIPSSARPAMQLYLGQTVFISVMPLLLATGSRLSEALTCRSYSQYLAHT